MPGERLINRNPYLYGPGPVRRVPTGAFTSYYYMCQTNPAKGFSMAALHGIVIALAGAFCYKFFIANPQVKAIEEYYRENPPR